MKQSLRQILISFDETPTGINNIQEEPQSNIPSVYTLQGVPVDPSTMRKGGLYIVNGKKVIMQ